MISMPSYCSEVDKRHFVCFQDCFIVRRKSMLAVSCLLQRRVVLQATQLEEKAK